MRISRRLAYSILIISVVFYGALVLQYWFSQTIIARNASELTKSSAQVLQQKVEAWLDAQSQVLISAAEFVPIADNDDILLSYLEALLRRNSSFFSIYFGRNDNTMINASGWQPPSGFDLRERPWYQEAAKTGRLAFTDVFLNASRDAMIVTIAVPVINEGELLGVVGGDLTLTTLVDLVSEEVVGQNGYAFLVDSAGNMLAHPRLNGEKLFASVALTELYPEVTLPQADEEPVVATTSGDNKGLLATQSIGGTGWVLGTFIPDGELGTGSRRLTLMFIFASIVYAFMMVGFFRIEKRYVLNPLHQLAQSIASVDVQPDKEQRIPLTGNRDVDYIARSFNALLERMKKYLQRQKQTEEVLRQSEARYRAIVEAQNDLVCRLTPDGTLTYVNESYCRFFGKNATELIGKKIWDFIPKQDHSNIRKYIRTLSSSNPTGWNENAVIRADGELRWVLWNDSVLFDQDGRFVELQTVGRDITEIKETEERLRSSVSLLNATIEATSEGIIAINNEGKVVAYNQRLLEMWRMPEELIETDWQRIVDWATPLVSSKPEERAKLRSKTFDTNETTYEVIELIDGRVFERFSNPQIVGEQIVGRVWSYRDITERRKYEEAIKHLSFHDGLTGLYNRAFWEEELKRLDTPRQLPISLIMGDVNGLKLANDAFGHEEGDRVLKTLASLWKNICREEDILARWGGDEFVLLLPRTSRSAALNVIRRLKDACQKAELNNIPISLALGAATKEDSSQDIFAVLRAAEDMMYRNKLLESKSARNAMISSLEKTLLEKSNETEEHTERLQHIAARVGERLGLSGSQFDDLLLLATLHDIGKIAIPEQIIKKPSRLSPSEWEIIKKHPEIGYRIALSSPELGPIAEGILSHHEWWDGSGYPRKLKGEQIPLIARIITILDAYDVITKGRVYKKARSHEEAIQELKRCSGIQFDPKLVDCIAEVLSDIKNAQPVDDSVV